MINRRANHGKIRDLYASIYHQNLTVEDAYRYLTQNDPDILKNKEQVLKIVEEKGLSSYMNNSKWLTLQKEICKLEFAPAYLEKCVTDAEFKYADVDTKNVSFLGNWSPYYMEGMPLFFNIEYLIIIPRYVKHVGRLMEGETIDFSDSLKDILTRNNIPFETINNNFVIFGYK